MDKKWAERLMGKGVEGDGGFRWTFFVLYIYHKVRKHFICTYLLLIKDIIKNIGAYPHCSYYPHGCKF
jgi:hypothetical protein